MDNNLVADFTTWERGKDYPEYMDEVALSTISKGYLLPGETPKKAYRRVAHAVAQRLRWMITKLELDPILMERLMKCGYV